MAKYVGRNQEQLDQNKMCFYVWRGKDVYIIRLSPLYICWFIKKWNQINPSIYHGQLKCQMGIFARALTQPAHQFAHQDTRIFFNWWFNWSASYMIDYVLWNESFCKGVVSYRLPTRLKLGYFLNYVLCRARNGFHFGSFLFFFFSFISFIFFFVNIFSF